MTDVLWIAGTIVVLGGLIAVALWMEPHWASKDGQRFISRAQLLGEHAQPAGRWREVRGQIDGERVVVRARGPFGGPVSGHWSVRGRGEMDRRKRHVYMLTKDGGSETLALRIPDNSRARPVLDDLIP